VEAVDANGRPDPNADQDVTFTLSGAGAIAAVGNADLMSEEPYVGNRRKLFRGKALVVVRSGKTAGPLTLSASAPGLKPATLTITVRRA
jgi:beta-galactosidase